MDDVSRICWGAVQAAVGFVLICNAIEFSGKAEMILPDAATFAAVMTCSCWLIWNGAGDFFLKDN